MQSTNYKMHYSQKEIRAAADEFREKYWPLNTIPVDIEKIADRRLGLDIIPTVGLASEADVLGFLTNDRTAIHVDNDRFNDSRFEVQLRFVFAHEIGHYVLHKDFYEANKFHSYEEWQDFLRAIDGVDLTRYEFCANEFAGRLLVPLELLIEEIEKIHPILEKRHQECLDMTLEDEDEVLKLTISDQIARKFGVTEKTIGMRLKLEGIRPVSAFEKLTVRHR